MKLFSIEIPNRMKGILWMIASCLFSALMMAMVRYLCIRFHPFQVVFFRNFFSLILFIPWLYKNGTAGVRTAKLPQYSVRAISGVIAMFMWFYALSRVPLSQATALSFSAPLFTTLAAVILLKEKTTIYRIAALAAGFLGTLIILRPGFSGFNYISLFVLFAAIFWSVSSLLIKSLTRTESPTVIVFYMTAMMTPLSFLPALLHWQTPQITDLLSLLLLGIVSTIFQLSLSRAFAKADLTAILPFDFLRLIFTAIIAYIAFAEIIDGWTIIGGVIILSSTIYVAYKESRLRPRAKTAPAMANVE